MPNAPQHETLAAAAAMETSPPEEDIARTLLQRRLENGGFEDRPGTGARPDVTALCACALARARIQTELIDVSADFLAGLQAADGRLSLTSEAPGAFWPTYLAPLAWRGSERHREHTERAVSFLLGITGSHPERKPGSPFGHDTSLRGWPWTEDTHSWVEPTSMALIALASAGIARHPRIDEAVAMLLDRQLPGGGWNYGNTTVFGQALPAMPAPAGAALQALAGRVSRDQVARSVVYSQQVLVATRSPLSLSWTLLGLGAWGKPHPSRENLIRESLSLLRNYGEPSSSDLALLLLALLCPGGLLEDDRPEEGRES